MTWCIEKLYRRETFVEGWGPWGLNLAFFHSLASLADHSFFIARFLSCSWPAVIHNAIRLTKGMSSFSRPGNGPDERGFTKFLLTWSSSLVPH